MSIKFKMDGFQEVNRKLEEMQRRIAQPLRPDRVR